jgi:Flp pilus assembly protein TadB
VERGLDWRRPRERAWLLFVSAVVLAVLAVVVARWSGPLWALAAAAVAGVLQGRLQERAKAQDRQQQLLAQFALNEGGRGASELFIYNSCRGTQTGRGLPR